jgi:two-component system phosphate regulon sensor histidine kinase PhoR
MFSSLSGDNKPLDLALILENLGEGVLALDDKGRVIEANPAFCRLFSVDRAPALGRSFLEVLRHAQLEAMRKKAVKTLAPVVEEVKLPAPVDKSFEARWIPLREGDVVTGTLLVLHDITRLKELERARQEFVANVSHEFQTPLSAIRGFAETLLDGAVDDKKHRLEFLSSIIKHTDQLSVLVRDLLTLSALESEKTGAKVRPVDLRELLRDTVNGLRPLADKKKVVFDLALSARLPKIRTDEKSLVLILTNILQNAIQYNRPGGSVKVRAAREKSRILVSVRDTGIGIHEDDLPRVFERFYRVDRDRSRETGGTGLGLAIAKRLVDKLGGSIGVESVLDQGSTFWFSLPIG